MMRLPAAGELGNTLMTHSSGYGMPFGNTRTFPNFSRLLPTSPFASRAFASGDSALSAAEAFEDAIEPPVGDAAAGPRRPRGTWRRRNSLRRRRTTQAHIHVDTSARPRYDAAASAASPGTRPRSATALRLRRVRRGKRMIHVALL